MTGRLSETDLARMRRAGLEPMGTRQALGLLDTALALDRPHLIPARLSARRGGADQDPRIAAPLPPAARAAAPSRAGAAPAAAGLPADPDDRRAALLELVREHAAAVLGLSSPTALRPGRQLTEAGIDSLTAVELRNRLNAATGLRLPATVLFDHPTPDALAAMLAARLEPESGGAPSGGREDGQDGVREELLRAVREAPLARLRQSGLLEALRGLADDPLPAGTAAPQGGPAIDGMSLDALVDLALTDDESPDSR
ncbi:hypothetical protein FZ103_21040 [Streptomonospora sp. PA3]|nr:hypothetical protein [Streptomonospora sp. PA3]